MMTIDYGWGSLKKDHRSQIVRELLSEVKNKRAIGGLQSDERIISLQQIQTIETCFEAGWDRILSLQLTVNELQETVQTRDAEIIKQAKNLERLEKEIAELRSRYISLIKSTSDERLTPVLNAFRQQTVKLTVSHEIREEAAKEYNRVSEEMKLPVCKDVKIHFGGRPLKVRYCGKLENGKPRGLGKLMIADKIIVANFNETYSEDEPIWKTRNEATGTNLATIYYQKGDLYEGTIRCSKNLFSREKGTLKVLGPSGNYSIISGEWDHKDELKQSKFDQLKGYSQTVNIASLPEQNFERLIGDSGIAVYQ